MYYCEFAQTKYARFGTMVPVEKAMTSGTGYSSIYQFSKKDALEIRRRGHSKGLKEFSVHSKWLWMDIDDECLERAEERFNELVERFKDYCKVGYFSGKKGYHLAVKTEPMYGRHVPYSHKRFIKEAGIEVDESLYQHGRLLRNPGAIHESTGVAKSMVLKTEGQILHIPLVVEPITFPEKVFTEDYTQDRIFRSGLVRALGILESPPSQGMRHTTLWSFAEHLSTSGASFELTLELCLYINRTFPVPKDDMEVENAVRQAYKGQALAGSSGS